MTKIFFRYSLILFLLFAAKSGIAQESRETGIDGYEFLTDAMEHPDEVEKIWISGNASQMDFLAKNCKSFKNLSAFKIKDASSDAGWDKFFTALSAVSSIREIELTFNEINTIPASISGFKNLENLTIWGSPNLDYSALFKNLSSLNKLKSLELNSNGLSTVPQEIKSLKHLERFAITDNEAVNYTDLMEKLSALINLTDLSLEVNSITQLPANIIKLKDLKKLNISNNYISTLPDNMSELNLLDSLQADGNLFVNYVDEFNKMKGLNISYISVDGSLTEEEKATLLNLFPKAKLDEKATAETSHPTTASATADLFEPLVPALNVPQTSYTVDTKQGAEINYSSGTQIKIPQDAFVDKNDQPVTGNVTVNYREFSTPEDIAFSGIPMMYSKDNQSYPMESAGMFEITATQNNQPVYLKKGKKIDVSLASTDSADTYNFLSH